MEARSPLAKACVLVVLTVLGLTFLAPLVWMVSTSLKPIEETMSMPPKWIPSSLHWENYDRVIVDRERWKPEEDPLPPFVRYGVNTLYLVVLGVAGTVVSNALVAYGFARIRWPGRDILFALTLATMMIPFPVLMVPVFGIFRELGWVGSFKPLWVPAWFGSAFNIFLLRQFFRTIPNELSDAARMDGCSELRVFWHVVLPLAKPALLVVALFHFMYTWNDFLGPLIYLTDQKHFTLSLGLQFFQSQHGGSKWNELMAASTLIVLPLIVVFFFTQRAFLKGIALTGMKG
jgi:multiple sugar transport system permease protein